MFARVECREFCQLVRQCGEIVGAGRREGTKVVCVGGVERHGCEGVYGVTERLNLIQNSSASAPLRMYSAEEVPC